jgi:hypothetical protein
MKASISLEAILVFSGMAVFWTLVFSAVAPRMEEAKEKAEGSQIQAECEKLASLIDTLSTYGEGIELNYTRFLPEGNTDLFFCQDAEPCSSNTITIIRKTQQKNIQAQCRTRIAEWVNIKSGGKMLGCKQAIEKEIREVQMTYATYNEKENAPRGCE